MCEQHIAMKKADVTKIKIEKKKKYELFINFKYFVDVITWEETSTVGASSCNLVSCHENRQRGLLSQTF